MKLKNFLIVVKDIERSRRFYHDLFGLEMVLDNGGNMILTEGLVLQEEKYWKEFLKKEIIPKNNSCAQLGAEGHPLLRSGRQFDRSGDADVRSATDRFHSTAACRLAGCFFHIVFFS